MVSTIRVVPAGAEAARGRRTGGLLHAMWRQKGLYTALFMWLVYAPLTAALFCRLEGWGAWDAWVYAGVLFTTIGYGTTTPVTPAGKLWTIAVAVPGIPMMLHALHWIGSLIAVASRRGIVAYRRCRGGGAREPSVRSEAGCTLALILLWYFHCVVVFWTMEEDFSFVTSCYFTFTTLSTIGFGDHQPLSSRSRRRIENFGWYHAWYSTMSVFGLAFLSQLFALAVAWLEHTDAHFAAAGSSFRVAARRLSLKARARRLEREAFAADALVARRKLLAAAYVERGDDWCDVLRRVDADGDGRITRAEFTAWCESRLHIHDHGDIDTVYALADRDGSGDLDVDELAWLLDSSQSHHAPDDGAPRPVEA